MGINYYALCFVECVTEYDICGFACDSSQFEEVIHVVGDLAVEIFDDHGHGCVY